MAYRLWRFRVEGVAHTVQMHHSWFTNHLRILVDGEPRIQEMRPLQPVTHHAFRVTGWWRGSIRIQSIGIECFYQCVIEGKVIEVEAEEASLLRASAKPQDDAGALLRPAASVTVDEHQSLLRAPPGEER